MLLTRTTPLFVVDAIEPALGFWKDTLGYRVVAEVPHEEKLGFVLLARDGHEVMFQTHASVRADLGPLDPAPSALYYTNVASLDEALAEVRAAGATVIVGPRTTFYGAKEIFVRDASGTIVAFAEHAAHG